MTQPNRDESVCPRCEQPFHCGVNDDRPCWCVGVALDGATLAALAARYRGCLCMRCLAQPAPSVTPPPSGGGLS
ncbi:cysteine-rich CWC family protein [Piscinibacter sp.]|jgi:hypothetical protein|uniref:cysteine-rich CWC family protein n=1 Tax=Piscinibacter sp. TaxID=1903157 RepID=UPI00391F36FD